MNTFFIHTYYVTGSGGDLLPINEGKDKTMATTFTNQATLSYNGSSVRSNIVVGSVASALSVDKQSLAADYSASEILTYVISIVNSGENDADGLTVTDDLGAYEYAGGTVHPLSYVADTLRYYLDGELQPDSALTVTDAGDLVISGVSVPASGSTILVYSAEVNDFAPLDAAASITNTAVVSGDGVCGAEARESIPAAVGPELSLLKSVTPVPVAENGELTYNFTLLNAGNTAVTADDNAAVSDVFSPALSDISVSMNGVPMTAGADYTYDAAAGVFETADGVLSIPAAEFTQDPVTGAWTTVPGSVELTVTGRVGTICDMAVERQ